jgi:hypothetical protein
LSSIETIILSLPVGGWLEKGARLKIKKGVREDDALMKRKRKRRAWAEI